MDGCDRQTLLAQLRKSFANFTKTSKHERNAETSSQLLSLFSNVMNNFTPDDIFSQFKEIISLLTHISEEFVAEIRRRANSENTQEAALSVYQFIRAEPSDSQGWLMLKSVIFIVNSGAPKVFESLCKTSLPNTLVKVSYLFMDLADPIGPEETSIRRRVFDSLVMLIMTLCSQSIVADELIQKDDLFLLFIGASSRSNSPNNIWRNANFTFLCAIMSKALTPVVLKYIHSKGCISHYLLNLSNVEEEHEKTILLCNLLDLLRSSAENSHQLLDDFCAANGFQFTVDTCVKTKNVSNNADQILSALTSLITAGDNTVQFNMPKCVVGSGSTGSSFHCQQMTQSISRSTGTVRNISAFKVLERCFEEGDDILCMIVLDKVNQLFRAERINYFIVDESSSLFHIIEGMIGKGVEVQERVLELVENVLRVLNYVPYKEISSLNLHLKNAVQSAQKAAMMRLLHFFLKVISANSNLKDAFRELSLLETFLHIVQTFANEQNLSDTELRDVVQMCMDLLISATKGNVLNAQFITENMDVKLVKHLLLLGPMSSDCDELKSSLSLLIKSLLYLAKNEQLFSAMLQLLFSEPGNMQLCNVILKLINGALLESHKVRIMFRRSGGFICLMTLLLHLENSLRGNGGNETLQYIALIFHVLTVSMRFEPSNARYFQNEVRTNMIDSILRGMGCFNNCTKIDTGQPVWELFNLSFESSANKLRQLHQLFQGFPEAAAIGNSNSATEAEIPAILAHSLVVLRLLLDLALDNYEKSSNEIRWADPGDWLRNSENMETVPVLSWTSATVLAHPTSILSILHLLPSIGYAQELDDWAAAAQLYIALVLKAILRLERNQQMMCQFDMPRELLDVGEQLFRVERHPLLSPFHYLFERLAYQSLDPSQLRHFLRLDKPLCCTNLDESEDEAELIGGKMAKAGGPVPIHRIKALVSMLTPRHHSLVQSPAFVELDLNVEGFAALLIPSIASMGQNGLQQNNAQQNGGGGQESTFQPLNGFTLAMWFNIAEASIGVHNNNGLSEQQQTSKTDVNSICLFSMVRNLTDPMPANSSTAQQNVIGGGGGGVGGGNIESHMTCFQVHFNCASRTLVVSSAEHSVADQLRKDFQRPAEYCVRVPLSEQYFPPKQWAHLAVVVNGRPALLKSIGGSNVEVYVNGCLLASQKLNFVWNTAANNAEDQQQQWHAYIGTLPFFRRPLCLRWRLGPVHFVEESLSADCIRKIVALGVAYIGNLQSSTDGPLPLVNEEKILLTLNPSSTAEISATAFRSLSSSKADIELVAALMGISPNDTSTPLRVLWNLANNSGSTRSPATSSQAAILIGYMGIRAFAPCPVSSLLESIGGLAPLFGLVAMSSDSSGLYASLKVLVSAMCTNRSIFAEINRTRGFQTLAILLEEKAHLMNSHILHLILTLAGTIDGSKDNVLQIPSLQTFEDLLCDLDVWKDAPDDVWKLLLEHFFELVIETNTTENLQKIRASTLLSRLLIYLFENRSLFSIRNDIVFRLVGAIVQQPCDGHSLLRLGQTISATISFDIDETVYPFDNAALEKKLLLSWEQQQQQYLQLSQQTNGTGNGGHQQQAQQQRHNLLLLSTTTAAANGGEEIDVHLYGVYTRNRLLNIICTQLAHASGQFNQQLSELIVRTLGFGWILALCGPKVHQGTLLLAMRILANVLHYPALVEKFRDGSSNGGWLSETDTVLRNRAGVLLGFSVAAQAGAVGSHVDVNPELDKCSGFASLEHVAYAHADKPFVYLALLSVLFQQHQANIHPLEEFSIEAVWSNVFALNEQCSVAHAIEKAYFCADTIIPLLALIRAALHKQYELFYDSFESNNVDHRKHWATNYPLMMLQLFNFLYQNSSKFFSICHTEAFVVVLFSSLLPPSSIPQTPNASVKTSSFFGGTEENAAGKNRCMKHAVELLTNILLNDLCLMNDGEMRTELLFDSLIEFLDSNGPSHNHQNLLFTELVNACLDHFMASKMFFINSASAPIIVPQSAKSRLNQSSEQTSANVVRFLSRLIDTVWNCLYKGNPIQILKCFLKLLSEAHASNKAAAQLTCTDVHITSLFRLILYLLSRPIDNVDTQMCVLDTLAEIVRNQHLFLTPKSDMNPLFYAALMHLVFMLSDRPQFDQQDPRNKQLERGTAQVSICAQNVWGILWQCKKVALEEYFHVRHPIDLDLYTARATCGALANKAWLQFVDSQTDGTFSSLNITESNSNRLLAAQKVLPQQLQNKLTKVVAKAGIQKLATIRRAATLQGGFGGSSAAAGVNNITSNSDSMAAVTAESLSELHRLERLRVEPETFYIWIRVHISLLKELIRNQCQRYHEWHVHVMKWCLQEWHTVEAELTRERGLWGPDHGSALDKFQLDVTEGPCRIRKKLVPNPDFYRHYPYRPNLEGPDAKPYRAKVAISRDSKVYYEKMCRKRAETMDERIVDWQVGAPSPSTREEMATEQAQHQNGDDPAVGELNMSMIKRMVQKNLELNEQQQKDEVEKEKKALVTDEEEEYSREEDLEEDEEEMEETNSSKGEESPTQNSTTAGIEPKTVTVNHGQTAATKTTTASNNPLLNKEEGSTSKDDGEDAIIAANATSAKKEGKECEQQNIVEQRQEEEIKRMSMKKQHKTSLTSQGPDNQTLLRLLEQGEQLHSMFRCARVQGLDTMEGLLLFGKDHFYVVDGFTLLKSREIRDLDFLPEQYHDPIIPYIAMGCRGRPQSTKTNRQCHKFAYEDIKEVHKRRYLLQQIAIEVFSADGRNFLLAFPKNVRERVYKKLVSMAKNASSDVVHFMNEQKRMRPTESSSTSSQLFQQLLGGQQSITQRWQRGEISNFHYLMYLNTLAGRSYNDLSQYPVFPWILADYDSDLLDLTNPKTFRDLRKPMGAQNPERLEQFLKRYREWDDPGGTPPYMYGTHYSSAMIVLSYLVRLEPFTQQFLKLQGGHFDLADRMFNSIRDAYKSAAKNNMADVKELIPEFFYLPEMFINQNNFDLGIKQNGVQLNGVLLPKWANGDPHEFVRLHRQALECDFVSEHLNEWIDLIFGHKQTGEAAKEASNVFHHLFYETSVDIESIEDPLIRNATLGFINNFGQIPSQLFKKPHPQRKVLQPSQQQGSNSANIAAQQHLFPVVPGVHVPKLFYHFPESLRVSSRPVKELRAAIGDIIVNNDKNQVIVLEQSKLLIPPSSFLAWGFYDRSIRFGHVGQEKSLCILETNDLYEITCMATTDGRQVFAGLSTGTILVWLFTSPPSSSNNSRQQQQQQQQQNCCRLVSKKALDGHSDVITAMAVNSAHNVLVSASRDKTAIVWHLTRLCFIRQLTGHPGPLTAVAVNEAKGDLATASGAFLFLWTINGLPLAMVDTADCGLFSNQSSLIYCISFSILNDWDENNVVICGTNDGLVKMYSLEKRQSEQSELLASNAPSNDANSSSSNHQLTVSRMPNAPGTAQQEVKEHLLRRQQRISHHYHRLTKSAELPLSSQDSQASSPLHPPSSTPFSSSQCSSQKTIATQHLFDGWRSIKWARSLRLRRILSEHTAFTHGNSLPAPITAIQPTKDHRSLLVGDGVGRIWMWTLSADI